MQHWGGDLRTNPIHRAGLKALTALLAAILAACGAAVPAEPGGPPPEPAGVSAPAPPPAAGDLLAGKSCPDAPGPIDAPIVANQVENLAAVDVGGGAASATPLTALPSGTRAYAPSWSPDGETLAFAFFFPAPDPALAWLQLGMICGLDRGSGKGRVLARAEFPESLEEASWAPDGRSLLLTRLRHQFNERNEFVSTATGVARYDLATGALTPLVADAIRPALSPDGALLAFIQLDDASGTVDRRLMVAAADGSQPKLLLDQRTNHWMLDAPRWSPDSRQLIVTASQRQQALRPPAPAGWLERWFGPATAEAHGDPAHLWLINADGGGLRQVTALPLDDPHGAWSPDGQRIAYVTTLGSVRLLDLGSKQETQLTPPGFAGLIDWNWTP